MTRVRTLLTTAGAIGVGLVRTVMNRGAQPRVVLKPGDAAPLFDLAGSDGQRYRLADMLGRGVVVLAWFPKAFTGGCTAECRSLGTSGDTLRGFDVRYFGASVDSPETNARFARSLGLDYPILSDPTRDVARAYGVLSASGYASRWTFYVGADGRILDIDPRVSAGSHGRDVASKLTELKVPTVPPQAVPPGVRLERSS